MQHCGADDLKTEGKAQTTSCERSPACRAMSTRGRWHQAQATHAGGTAPAGYKPWFEVPGRRAAGNSVTMGHWRTLGRPNCGDPVLDSGRVRGACLTAVRLDLGRREVHQTNCRAAQWPGS